MGLVALGDGDEIVCLEGCSADQAAVNVFLAEKLLGVGRLAASSVEDGRFFSKGTLDAFAGMLVRPL